MVGNMPQHRTALPECAPLDKANIVELERCDADRSDMLKGGPVDYSGAAAKTDPVEIALVRKLDRRILPMLCAMYFLNYVSPGKVFCTLKFNS